MEDLIKKIHDLSGPVLFRDEDGLVDECKNFLILKGYGVRAPLKEYKNIKKLDDIIELFYSLLSAKHPEMVLSPQVIAKDRQIAKLFIKSRQNILGISKAQAVSECVAIIRAIIKYEDKFNFNRPLDFSILGQEHCGWITQKAVSIINNEKDMEREQWRLNFVTDAEEKAYEELGGPTFTDNELDNILKGLMGD